MKADRFLDTVRDDVIEPDDVVNVSALRASLQRLEPAIAHLAHHPGEVSELLSDAAGRSLVGLLLGVPADELEPPTRYPPSALARWQEWTDGEPLRGVVIGLLLREAHTSRARRRRTKLSEMVATEVERTAKRRDLLLRVNARVPSVGRSFDFLVESDAEPILAVLVIFQTRVGGRQMQIFEGLPDLQSSLIRHGIVLAVVADGPGFRNMSYVVRRVAPRLQHLMNAHGLESGELRKAVSRAIRVSRGERTIGDPSNEELLDRISQVALRSGRTVTAGTLNLPVDEAEAFLVRFGAMHPEYDVEHVEGKGLVSNAAETLAGLARAGDARGPVAPILAEHLGYAATPAGSRDDVLAFGVEIPDARLRLPTPLPLLEIRAPRERNRGDLLATADEMLRAGPLVARLGVLVDRVDPTGASTAAASLAKTGRAQFAVLDDTDLGEILLRRRQEGRAYLIQRLVEGVDLGFISPFISEGPTPSSMFFGRDNEIRRIMEQAGRQSFALVGGRKAGKTSILRRLEALLQPRAAVRLLDLQAHPDRADFLRYLVSLTEAPPSVRNGFEVAAAERIVTAFVDQAFPGTGAVLLLDEVDDLFHGDATATSHPHVLSRALRSVAQSGKASVVVTGERSLYGLTRDASSPHWNFCTPLIIGPLADEDAASLLAEPLATLGIDIGSEALGTTLDRTARHPNLIQFLGDHLVQSLAPASGGGERLAVTRTDVAAVTSTPSYSRRFTTTFWSQATPLERAISVLMSASKPKSADSVLGEVRQHGGAATAIEVSDALSYLELYTIVRATPEGFLLRAPAFDDYLGQVRGTAIFDQWVGQLG